MAQVSASALRLLRSLTRTRLARTNRLWRPVAGRLPGLIGLRSLSVEFTFLSQFPYAISPIRRGRLGLILKIPFGFFEVDRIDIRGDEFIVATRSVSQDVGYNWCCGPTN